MGGPNESLGFRIWLVVSNTCVFLHILSPNIWGFWMDMMQIWHIFGSKGVVQPVSRSVPWIFGQPGWSWMGKGLWAIMCSLNQKTHLQWNKPQMHDTHKIEHVQNQKSKYSIVFSKQYQDAISVFIPLQIELLIFLVPTKPHVFFCNSFSSMHFRRCKVPPQTPCCQAHLLLP